MKKLVAGLITGLLVAAGLVAISGETATAVCTPSQYVQCENVATKATHAKTVKKGHRPTAVVVVRARGNYKPRGTLTITITGPGVDKSYTLAYRKKPVTFVGPKVKKAGTYQVTIVFKTKVAGIKDSKTTYKFTVTK